MPMPRPSGKRQVLYVSRYTRNPEGAVIQDCVAEPVSGSSVGRSNIFCLEANLANPHRCCAIRNCAGVGVSGRITALDNIIELATVTGFLPDATGVSLSTSQTATRFLCIFITL